jgi:hypothetical protein
MFGIKNSYDSQMYHINNTILSTGLKQSEQRTETSSNIFCRNTGVVSSHQAYHKSTMESIHGRGFYVNCIRHRYGNYNNLYFDGFHVSRVKRELIMFQVLPVTRYLSL